MFRGIRDSGMSVRESDSTVLGAEVHEPEAHDREVVARQPREHVVHHLYRGTSLIRPPPP